MMSDRTFNAHKGNWSKCITGLNVTKEALHGYIEDTFRQFGLDLETKSNQNYSGHHGVEGFFEALPHIKFDKTKRRWHMDNKCSGCEPIFEEIMSNHIDRHKHNASPTWSNCYGSINWLNECGGRSLYWTLAKVFMEPGNAKSLGPKESNASALFQVMIHCKRFDAIEFQYKQDLIEVRNRLIASVDDKVDNDDMNDIFDKMINFLEHTELKDRPECKEAAQTLKKLKENRMVMSLQSEDMYQMMRRRHDIEVKMGETETNDGDRSVADMTALEELKQQLQMCEQDVVFTTSVIWSTARMMSDRTFNAQKGNWSKCITGLNVTKEALHGYIEDTFRRFELDLGTKANQNYSGHGFKGFFVAPSHIKFDKTRGQWHMDYTCPGCVPIFEEIMSNHIDRYTTNASLIGWSNCQGSIIWQNAWGGPPRSLYWALAKVFMKPGNAKSLGPNESDASALFQVMVHCKRFDAIELQYKKDLIEVRKSLIASADDKVDNDDMNYFFDKMINFLEHRELKDRPECKEAAQTLKKLKENRMVMSLQSEDMYQMMRRHHDIEVKMGETETNDGDRSVADMSALEELKHQLKMCEQDVVFTTRFSFHQAAQLRTAMNEKGNLEIFEKLEAEIEKLEAEKCILSNIKNQLQKQIVIVKKASDNKLGELDKRIEELTGKLRRCEQCLEESRAGERALKQQLEDSKDQIKQIEAEKSKSIQQVEKPENETVSLKTEIQSLEDDKRKMTNINIQPQEEMDRNREERDRKKNFERKLLELEKKTNKGADLRTTLEPPFEETSQTRKHSVHGSAATDLQEGVKVEDAESIKQIGDSPIERDTNTCIPMQCKNVSDEHQHKRSVEPKPTLQWHKFPELKVQLASKAEIQSKAEPSIRVAELDADINNTKLHELCIQHGRRSPKIGSLCRQISKHMLSCSKYIKNVWAAYRKLNENDIVFVICTDGVLKEDFKFPSPLNTFEVVYRKTGVFSKENKHVMEGEQRTQTNFTDDETDRLRITLQKESQALMEAHQNLNIISACPVKSRNYDKCSECRNNGNCSECIIKETCVVLYVNVKGLIPIQEDALPSSLGGFPTDIREGAFELYSLDAQTYNEVLQMGRMISSKVNEHGVWKTGTLGAFVDLPDGRVCCITSAHTVLEDADINTLTEKKNIDQDVADREIFQPNPLAGYSHFGHVIKAVYREGGFTSTGTEAVLIQVTDPARCPQNGDFPDGDFDHTGFTSADPITYVSGEIHKDIDKNLNNTALFKFGYATGLTKGAFYLNGPSVRKTMFNEYTPAFGLCLHNQLQVVSIGPTEFADHGDSGALVMAEYDKAFGLRAVGIVTGGTSDKTSFFVTPIACILDAFGLNHRLKKFASTSPIGIYIDKEEAMNSIPQTSNVIGQLEIDRIDNRINHLEDRLGKYSSEKNKVLTDLKTEVAEVAESNKKLENGQEQIIALLKAALPSQKPNS